MMLFKIFVELDEKFLYYLSYHRGPTPLGRKFI
jgi:hypothetical protein